MKRVRNAMNNEFGRHIIGASKLRPIRPADAAYGEENSREGKRTGSTVGSGDVSPAR